MSRLKAAETAVLDAESSVLAAAFALRREHGDACPCRLCRAVSRYREALRAWGDERGSRALGSHNGARAR